MLFVSGAQRSFRFQNVYPQYHNRRYYYTARCLVPRTAQRFLHPTAGRPVNFNANAIFLASNRPRFSYCAKNVFSRNYIRLCLSSGCGWAAYSAWIPTAWLRRCWTRGQRQTYHAPEPQRPCGRHEAWQKQHQEPPPGRVRCSISM